MLRIFGQYLSLQGPLRISLDSLFIASALLAGTSLFDGNAAGQANDPQPFVLRALLAAACFEIFFWPQKVDRQPARLSRRRQTVLLARASIFACLALGLVYTAMPGLAIGREALLAALGPLFGSLLWLRSSTAPGGCFAQVRERVLILGAGRLAWELARELRRRRDLPIEISALLPAWQPATGDMPASADGAGQGTADFIENHGIQRVFVALDDRRGNVPLRELLHLRFSGVRIDDAEEALAALTGHVRLENVRPSWFLFSDGFRRGSGRMAFKRATDLVLSLLGLVTAAPLMAVIAAAIRLDSPGPVLLRQRRVGRHGRCFELLKFRTMRKDAEPAGTPQWACKDDPRITRLGKYLRRYRLDELPQFWNVLRGEMSLVGPRPERPEFVRWLRNRLPYFDERHSVRPGLTGWAQVRQRYAASLDDSREKLSYDIFYLKNMSFLFDLFILVRTVKIVFLGLGAR